MRKVTAAIIIEDGRLLLTRRPAGDALAGLWELPGGKVEYGETPEDCLSRELEEELDMASQVCELLAQVTYEYSHGAFELMAYRVRRESPFHLRFHDALAWVTPADVQQLDLAPADVLLVQQLHSAGHWL